MFWNFNPKGPQCFCCSPAMFIQFGMWLKWMSGFVRWIIKQLDKVHGFCYILYHVISFPPCGKLITIKQRRFTRFKGRSQMENVMFTCFFVLKKSNWKNQHPTNLQKPHGITSPKPENQTTRWTGFYQNHPTPTPVENSHGKTEFSTQEKDYVFQPGPAEAIGMCLTEDGVSFWKSFWDGEVYVNINCQSVF